MTDLNPLVSILEEAFTIFRRQAMRNLFFYARDNGLSMPQFGAMFHISHSAGCGVSDIGNDLGITNSAASQLLERLVQLNLISRTEDPLDRRGKLIVLTDKGRQILQEGNLANRKWLEDLVLSMTSEEQLQVQQAFRILVDKARLLETENDRVTA
jgi:DNA-binding MarR family transcriptional regulator